MNAPQDPGVIRPTRFEPTRDEVDRRLWHQRHRNAIVAGAAAFAVLWFMWFIFTAKSVRILADPADAGITISGGFALELGGVQVLREGEYSLRATADGYHPLEVAMAVGPDRNQTFTIELEKLPGIVNVISVPPGASVAVDGAPLGETPLAQQELSAGEHDLELRHPRYETAAERVTIEGMGRSQDLRFELLPNWAEVTIATEPPGATVSVDDTEAGTTPGPVEVLAGTHRIRVKLTGYEAWERDIDVVARTPVTLPPVRLQPADGLVMVVTRPSKAGVMVDGAYRGESPVELRLDPGRRYQIRAFKPGYQAAQRSLAVASNREERLELDLEALIGRVIVRAEPADAEVFVNGASRGAADQTLALAAVPHTIEVRKPGYAGYSTRITPQPGLTQEVKVKLLTIEQARIAALTPTITSPVGQELILVDPGKFTAGSSRREPGRRANEVVRDVTITRLFYLGAREVTNAEFRRFASAHSSDDFEEQKLDGEELPVSGVSWLEAALYCNWLSEQAKLATFYEVELGKVTGFDRGSTGYRLPTEAEWEWATRRGAADGVSRRFPWGDDLPPPDRLGNFADRAAAHLVGRVVFGYNDNYIVAAPVGSFKPDSHGFYDLAGNVAEWVHDFYEIPPASAVTDPMGPDAGEYHVIRGSSWMHGTITDLRTSFRDYGADGRPDLGFRIARFAE